MTIRRCFECYDQVRLKTNKHWHFLRHTTLSDLHPRSRPYTRADGKYGKNQKLTLSQTPWLLHWWNLAQWCFGARPYRHTSLSDLHPKSRSQGLIENLEKLKRWHFLKHYYHYSWNLAQRYVVSRPFRPYHFLWPSFKVTVTRPYGNPWKSSDFFFQTLSSLQPWKLS